MQSLSEPSTQTTTMTVSPAGIKALAQKHLAKDSQLRSLIMQEPDYLHRQEAIAKVDLFAKMLWQELSR